MFNFTIFTPTRDLISHRYHAQEDEAGYAMPSRLHGIACVMPTEKGGFEKGGHGKKGDKKGGDKKGGYGKGGFETGSYGEGGSGLQIRG